VDLELAGGECLGVVGESGSGKTTLTRCLLRLVEPTDGQVVYRGMDVLALGRTELRAFRKQVQLVFQDAFGSLNPRCRAGKTLEEVLLVHAPGLSRAARRSRTLELLDLVGLNSTHVHRFPHQLSGGQRQRLGIARALAVDPETLVLDEPVASLDLSIQAQVLQLLSNLRERLKLSLILVAHDLTVVRQVADRVVVMYGGKVMESGPASALFDRPSHPYTRGLLAAAGHPGSDSGEPFAWEPLPMMPGDGGPPPSGCIYHPRCPHPDKDRRCELQTPQTVVRSGGGSVACWKEMEDGHGA
jgi:oligopeptide/dipeptide ABC transporter ATP-binding protein